MRFKKVLGVVTLAVAIGVVGSVNAAGAAAPATDLPFAEQARTLGLSDTQAVELQEEVTTYLDQTGGEQVAINKIDRGDGGSVLLTLPGETYARDLENPSAIGLSACPAGRLCMYSGPNYTGVMDDGTACPGFTVMTWETQGSYANRLSGASRGTFVINDGAGGVRRSFTPPAPSQSPTWNWLNTWAVWACQMG